MTLALHGFPDWQTSLNTGDLQVVTSNQAVGGGGFVFLDQLDMRLYSSCIIRADCLLSVAPTVFNPVELDVQWCEDVAGTTTTWEDAVHFFAGNNTGSGFDSDTGRLLLQDVVHGPYLQVLLGHNGADDCAFTLTVYGHTRSIPGQYLMETRASLAGSTDVADLVVANIATTVGVGLSKFHTTRVNPGKAYLLLTAAGAPVTLTMFHADGRTLDQFVAAVAVRQEIHLPRAGLKFQVANAGGALATYTLRIVRAVAGSFT